MIQSRTLRGKKSCIRFVYQNLKLSGIFKKFPQESIKENDLRKPQNGCRLSAFIFAGMYVLCVYLYVCPSVYMCVPMSSCM